MNPQVEIQVQFSGDEAFLADIKRFFASYATVRVSKEEPLAVKSLESVLEIIIVIVGTWATEKYVLDPLAEKAGEWKNCIREFWGKSGFRYPVNVLVRFEQPGSSLEIQFVGNHRPDVVDQVWRVVKQVIAVLKAQDIQVEKVRITTNANGSLLVLGYSGNQPDFVIDLDKKAIRHIESSGCTGENDLDREARLWYIDQLGKRLMYLRFIREKDLGVSETEIVDLEEEIRREKESLGF